MPGENDEVVGSLGRELVSRLAPEELPLYPSLLSQFNGAAGARGRKASSDDDLLGFGGAEIITMLTPVILNFTSCFWQALMNEAAESSTQGVLAYVRSHLPGHHEAERVPLSPDQLQLVRAVAEREARRLDIGGKRAGLLADAMVGALVAPPGP
jgi:hypothetical protein